MRLAAVALMVQLAVASPALGQADVDRAVHNYQLLLARQKQFYQLTPQERADVLELDRKLRSGETIRAKETKEQCIERLGSENPTHLEQALLDLKCSQRPAG